MVENSNFKLQISRKRKTFRHFRDAEHHGFAKVRGEDLDPDGEIFRAVEGGGAAGNGHRGYTSEVRGDRENIGEVILQRIVVACMDFPGGCGCNG